jgi:hypothetical protein
VAIEIGTQKSASVYQCDCGRDFDCRPCALPSAMVPSSRALFIGTVNDKELIETLASLGTNPRCARRTPWQAENVSYVVMQLLPGLAVHSSRRRLR